MNPRLRFFKKIPEHFATYTIASARVGAWFGASLGAVLGSYDANKVYVAAREAGSQEPFQAASNAAIVTFSRCTVAGLAAGPVVAFSPFWVPGLLGAKRMLRDNIDDVQARPKI